MLAHASTRTAPLRHGNRPEDRLWTARRTAVEAAVPVEDPGIGYRTAVATSVAWVEHR